MIRAELQQSYFDEQHDDFAWRTVASITVEDDGTHHGECPERFGLRKVVLDPERHERVRFDDDPARWLRWLPDSYRTGDLAVHIVHDDDPPASTITGGGMTVGA